MDEGEACTLVGGGAGHIPAGERTEAGGVGVVESKVATGVRGERKGGLPAVDDECLEEEARCGAETGGATGSGSGAFGGGGAGVEHSACEWKSTGIQLSPQ